MLELTPAAQAAIAKVITEAGDDIFGLRVAVSLGGCAGLQYRMGLEIEPGVEDTVMEAGNVRVLVDPVSLSWLDGATVDFRETAFETGFVFDNPNAAGMCSCGKSSCG